MVDSIWKWLFEVDVTHLCVKKLRLRLAKQSAIKWQGRDLSQGLCDSKAQLDLLFSCERFSLMSRYYLKGKTL